MGNKGHSCYRPRRTGERKRKSVRGCIVDGNLAVLAMAIVKKGDAEIPGLTDNTTPRRLGPKRGSKIRKLFNLSKEEDVRKEQTGGRRVLQDSRPASEGGQGGERVEEEALCLPPREPQIHQQPIREDGT